MNFELSKNAVISLIVVAVILIGAVFWQLMKPKEVPFPEGYDYTGGGATAPAGGNAPAPPPPVSAP